ncbi:MULTISPECIES: hypothetical protein [Acinetobacter]|nr:MULTISPECIES: hypothetical protein [Acinetobacter]
MVAVIILAILAAIAMALLHKYVSI